MHQRPGAMDRHLSDTGSTTLSRFLPVGGYNWSQSRPKIPQFRFGWINDYSTSPGDSMRVSTVKSLAAFAVVVLVGCGGGGGGSSSGKSSIVAITVSPTSTSLAPNAQQQFTAAVTGSTNTTVTWQVAGGTGGNAQVGTIDSTGLYTAPAKTPKPPSVTVSAIPKADSSKLASATVTISPPSGAANQAEQALPVKLGTSGGNVQDSVTTGNTITCCSGTLGALVSRAGTLYVLSNNHVLGRSNQAKAGEQISQPGLVDSNPACSTGGTNTVATLSQFVPFPTGGTQTNPKIGTVDAAIAQVAAGAVDASGAILDFDPAGAPNAAPPANTVETPALNVAVAKAGRSTGLTCSTIGSINTNVVIGYSTSCGANNSFFVEFDNQVVVNGASFSAGGDSGSLIVDALTAQPVALLYGGDTNSTVGHPINDVLNALKDSKSNVPVIVGGAQHAIPCGKGLGAEPREAQAATASSLAHATEVSSRNGTKLISSNPAIVGLGVGSSSDAPGEAAILLYVDRNRSGSRLPAEVEGVRTKIVSKTDTKIDSGSAVIAASEVQRALQVKEQQARELMKNRAIFGVGVSASEDAEGEAAIIIYEDQDLPANSLPATIQGVRTKIVRTDRFRASGWNERARRSCSAPGE
jgi:hypothetical protein